MDPHWTLRDWFGPPRRPSYWWNDKPYEPGPPPPDLDPKVVEEWMSAWAAVEGTIDQRVNVSSDDAKTEPT